MMESFKKLQTKTLSFDQTNSRKILGKAIAICAIAVACTIPSWGQSSFQGPDGYNNGLPIHWHTIKNGSTPGLVPPSTNLIYTPGQLATFWYHVVGSRTPLPSGIRWGRQMVIAVVGGTQPAGTSVRVLDIHHQTPAKTLVSWCFAHSVGGINPAGFAPGTGSDGISFTGATGPVQIIGGPPVGQITVLNTSQAVTTTGAGVASPYEIEVLDVPSGTIQFQNLPPVTLNPEFMYLGPNCGYGFPGYGVNDAWPWTVIGYGPGSFSSSPFTGVIYSPLEYLRYSRTYFDGWVNLPSSFTWYQYSLVAINPGILKTPSEIRILGMRRIGSGRLELNYALVPRPQLQGNRYARIRSEKGFVRNPFAVVSIPRTRDQIIVHRVQLK